MAVIANRADESVVGRVLFMIFMILRVFRAFRVAAQTIRALRSLRLLGPQWALLLPFVLIYSE